MWPPSPDGVATPFPALNRGPTRRQVLGLAFAAGLLPGSRAHAALTPSPGLVLPRRPAPDLALVNADGRSTSLSTCLRGKVTAVQLMFAGCSSVCPIQGAIFAEVARKAQKSGVQLLSLTIDPLGDSPQVLHSWLDRFGRHPTWTAAAPRVQDVDALAEFLRGAPVAAGSHTTQVFLLDRQARLAFRTVERPSAEHLVDLLEQLAAA